MTNRTKGEMTRSRVLEAARSLINTKGFNNTTVNDIIHTTGVKKGNLYFHFSSKEDLSVAILQEATKDFFLFLSKSLQGKSPLEKLCNFLDAVFEKHRKTNFVGGCLFGNTALEMSDINPRFSNLIEEVFRKWTDIIAEVLVEAQDTGDLKQEIPPSLLAKQIVASIEGGIMMARVSKNEDDLRDCLRFLRILLGA